MQPSGCHAAVCGGRRESAADNKSKKADQPSLPDILTLSLQPHEGNLLCLRQEAQDTAACATVEARALQGGAMPLCVALQILDWPGGSSTLPGKG